MSGANGVTPASAFMNDATRVVTSPHSGRSVRIRRLMSDDLTHLQVMDEAAQAAGTSIEARADAIARRQGNGADEFKAIILRGIVEPRVVDIAFDQVNPEEGEVHWSAIGMEDATWYAAEIMRFSGFEEEAAERADGFPVEPGSGGAAAHDVSGLRRDVAVTGTADV